MSPNYAPTNRVGNGDCGCFLPDPGGDKGRECWQVKRKAEWTDHEEATKKLTHVSEPEKGAVPSFYSLSLK